jgi:hypothetical protein
LEPGAFKLWEEEEGEEEEEEKEEEEEEANCIQLVQPPTLGSAAMVSSLSAMSCSTRVCAGESPASRENSSAFTSMSSFAPPRLSVVWFSISSVVASALHCLLCMCGGGDWGGGGRLRQWGMLLRRSGRG